MALSPGTRLGPYEVTAKIGEGGMGEVYRATDTTLKRAVAIKVLPESVAADPERLARFQREAEVLAALNHPHIAAIYGLEKSTSTIALVMELVEGPTLADLIAGADTRGRESALEAEGRASVRSASGGGAPRGLSIDEALPIAKQIAEALEAAHEQGIIHRDLKPANIKVKDDGTVKVLDFGLAKAMEPPRALSPGVSQSPTITTPAMTQAGMILGTAAYMSPEQAKGRAVDKRSDVWAFGCVLYEMLTGQRAFGGEDVSETLADVMRVDPAWEQLPAGLTPSLTTFLKRCLQKDRNQRLADIHDMRLALEGAFETTGAAPPDARDGARPVWPRSVTIAVATLLGLVGGGLGGWTLTRPAPDSERVTRFVVTADGVLPRAAGPLLALSRDGSMLAYVSNRAGVRQIYRRNMEKFEDEPIPGTEEGGTPAFSPDGNWLAFESGGTLKKVSLSGGPSVTICVCGTGAGATWGGNDAIVFTARDRGLAMVPASGGSPRPLTTLGAGETIHRQPTILPGGNALLFAALTGSIETAAIEVYSFDTGGRRHLVDGTHPSYSPTGHIVFVRAESLWAIAFDIDTLETRGEAIPLVEGVLVERGGAAQVALADNGTLVYVPIGGAGVGAARAIVLVDRAGTRTPLEQELRDFSNPRFSPDGRRILLQVAEEGQSDIWLYDVERGTLGRQTLDAISSSPVWTPDGARLTFTSYAGSYSLFWKLADGTKDSEQLLRAGGFPRARSWSPDGTRLSYQEQHSETGSDIWIFSRDEQTASPFLATPANEDWSVFSPDGQWIAYESDESGQREVYVTTYPDAERKRQVSIAGGAKPRWRFDGSELFYISGDGALMAVAVATSPTSQLGAPRPLFEVAEAEYDVHPSGERFLIVRTERPATPGHINVVFNWLEELKARVPVP